MGLSGVGIWGSDIGGYFSFNGRMLTDELLTRWIELGAVSGVMRTERDGIAVPSYERPQVEDESHFAVWRRYAKLRTQLYPYIAAAAEEYQRSGMPIMRHLVLVHPDDANVLDRDDEFLFGPDLLAAPVLAAGETSRHVYLPAGSWVNFWKAVRFVPEDGSFELGDAADVIAGGVEGGSTRRWTSFRSSCAPARSSRCFPRRRHASPTTGRTSMASCASPIGGASAPPRLSARELQSALDRGPHLLARGRRRLGARDQAPPRAGRSPRASPPWSNPSTPVRSRAGERLADDSILRR
jgi:hypothetical protein